MKQSLQGFISWLKHKSELLQGGVGSQGKWGANSNELLQSVLSCNAGPSWLWECCSVGNHISWHVTVQGSLRQAKHVGTFLTPWKSMAVPQHRFTAQLERNNNTKMHKKECWLMLLFIIKAFVGHHVLLPAQPITCSRGLKVEAFREENKIRMRQTWLSPPQEKLHDASSYFAFMWPQKLSLAQSLLSTEHFPGFSSFRTLPQQASLQAPICNVCMLYQEASNHSKSIKRHQSTAWNPLWKSSIALLAVEGRSVTSQVLSHSKSAEANSNNFLSESSLKRSPRQHQGALFGQKSLFSEKAFIHGYPNARNQVAFWAIINPGVLATLQFE